MVDEAVQNAKKKTVKELNIYTEALEERIVTLEKIIKDLKVNPEQVEESLKSEDENTKKIN